MTDQPEGIAYDSDRLPTLAGAARRVNDFLEFFGDGLVYAETGAPPLFARDLQALTNHVTGQGTQPPGSKTEWGCRDRHGQVHSIGVENETQARAMRSMTPVRREVGPWTEVDRG